MILKPPDIMELQAKCEQGATILIAAPFYSAEGLEWVRPKAGGEVEFWTRLNPHDWATGVSDPPALLRYLETVGESRVSLRVHRALHAKIYNVDDSWSWIGSPNLSRAAFTSNIELVAELESDEAASLAAFVDVLRGSLRELDLATFRHFIEASRDAVEGAEDPESWEDDDLQAAVSLADELLAPQPTLDRPQTLRTLEEFIAFVESLGDDAVPTTVLDHYHNTSGQNRQGHVRQSYYGLLLFFSSATGQRHVEELRGLPLGRYPALPPSFVKSWVPFLDQNANLKDEDQYRYSLSTLRNVLPERLGGYVMGGGGGVGTFVRLAPLVARFLAA